MRPRVKYQIIHMNRNRYPVSVMCQFFCVSRSGYYDYVKRLDQPAHDAVLAEMIRKQQKKCDKTYGYRRMWKWLRNTKKIPFRYIRFSNIGFNCYVDTDLTLHFSGIEYVSIAQEKKNVFEQAEDIIWNKNPS